MRAARTTKAEKCILWCFKRYDAKRRYFFSDRVNSPGKQTMFYPVRSVMIVGIQGPFIGANVILAES